MVVGRREDQLNAIHVEYTADGVYRGEAPGAARVGAGGGFGVFQLAAAHGGIGDGGPASRWVDGDGVPFAGRPGAVYGGAGPGLIRAAVAAAWGDLDGQA